MAVQRGLHVVQFCSFSLVAVYPASVMFFLNTFVNAKCERVDTALAHGYLHKHPAVFLDRTTHEQAA